MVPKIADFNTKSALTQLVQEIWPDTSTKAGISKLANLTVKLKFTLVQRLLPW